MSDFCSTQEAIDTALSECAKRDKLICELVAALLVAQEGLKIYNAHSICVEEALKKAREMGY